MLQHTIRYQVYYTHALAILHMVYAVVRSFFVVGSNVTEYLMGVHLES